jgi:hypothetical protein
MFFFVFLDCLNCILISSPNVSARETPSETKGTCNLCGTKNDVKKCLGCNKVFYCSKNCQASDWPSHRPFCGVKPQSKPDPKPEPIRLLSSVVVVDGDHVTEQMVAIDDMSETNGWKDCEVTSLLGVKLRYKVLPHAKNDKEKKLKEIAQVFLTRPDRMLLNGLEIINDANGNYARILVKDPVTRRQANFEWSETAWKIKVAKELGPVMFARVDKQKLRANLFWDMFNYIYDLMEYYRHGVTFVVGTRKVCQFATPVEFAKFTGKMTDNFRRECTLGNLHKFPKLTANTANWM